MHNSITAAIILIDAGGRVVSTADYEANDPGSNPARPVFFTQGTLPLTCPVICSRERATGCWQEGHPSVKLQMPKIRMYT